MPAGSVRDRASQYSRDVVGRNLSSGLENRKRRGGSAKLTETATIGGGVLTVGKHSASTAGALRRCSGGSGCLRGWRCSGVPPIPGEQLIDPAVGMSIFMRLPLIAPDELTPEQRRLYQDMRAGIDQGF